MCLVRKTVNDKDGDPYYQNIGIISLEDIIEEIIQDEIEDEIDQEKLSRKNGEGATKQKLLDLFSEKRCSRVLSDHERNAISSYLSKYEEPFKRNQINSKSLEELVAHSEVINVHSTENEVKETESDEEEEKVNGVIEINTKNKGDDLEKQETDDITVIKSSKLKSHFGKHAVSSSGLKVDEINLKFNPKFKSKTQIPYKDQSIPEVSEESNYFEQSESEINRSLQQNETDNALNEIKYSDESDSNEAEQEEGKRKDEPLPHLNFSDINPTLFIRNAPADKYYLVLRGKVEIISGKDGFKVEIGSFSSIGAKALIDEDYKPDFSAKVLGEARLLCITRTMYVEYLR